MIIIYFYVLLSGSVIVVGGAYVLSLGLKLKNDIGFTLSEKIGIMKNNPSPLLTYIGTIAIVIGVLLVICGIILLVFHSKQKRALSGNKKAAALYDYKGDF